MKVISTSICILKKNVYSRGGIHTCFKNFSSQNTLYKCKDIGSLFIQQDVQSILKKITGLNLDKIFAVKYHEVKPHTYEYVTEKRLRELQEDTVRRAKKKIQMPPVMAIREEINEVLAKDPELQGYLECKYIFTDLSPSYSSRERIITVREIDGTLRKATWEERDRMNQIFFPIPGKDVEVPVMFESPYFERLLDEGSYEFVLGRTCVQFEPDSPEYHKHVNTTYEHIKKFKKFDVLRSTRHFGPMAFYFAHNKDIDGLLLDMIERQLMSDAADTVKLLYILHPECQTNDELKAKTDIEIVQDYIAKHSLHKDYLELAIQTYLEQQQAKLQKEEALV